MNNRGLTVKLNGSEIKDAVREGIREYKAEQCGNPASIGTVLIDMETGRKYIVVDAECKKLKDMFGTVRRIGEPISYTVKPI